MRNAHIFIATALFIVLTPNIGLCGKSHWQNPPSNPLLCGAAVAVPTIPTEDVNKCGGQKFKKPLKPASLSALTYTKASTINDINVNLYQTAINNCVAAKNADSARYYSSLKTSCTKAIYQANPKQRQNLQDACVKSYNDFLEKTNSNIISANKAAMDKYTKANDDFNAAVDKCKKS